MLAGQQHGFVKKKSCTTNLLETIDFITFAIENGIPVDVVLLDFAKAFDTVAHKRLLLKLKAYGIDGLVLKWIESFLTKRRQRIVKGEIIYAWFKDEILDEIIFESLAIEYLFGEKTNKGNRNRALYETLYILNIVYEDNVFDYFF